MTKEELLQAIGDMTVLELADLVKALEEKFGVSATAPLAPHFEKPPTEEQIEQTEFDIVLTSIGDQKIQVIKAVRELTNLGLRESKSVVDSAPSDVLKGVSKEMAMAAKKSLTSAGASVEIK